MMRILLDTNFLVDLFRFNIDPAEIFDLLPGSEISTLDVVLSELEKIARSRGKDAMHAKIALKFVRGMRILPSASQSADRALLEMCKDSVVATNDAALRKKISAKGGKTIYLRAKKHLALS